MKKKQRSSFRRAMAATIQLALDDHHITYSRHSIGGVYVFSMTDGVIKASIRIADSVIFTILIGQYTETYEIDLGDPRYDLVIVSLLNKFTYLNNVPDRRRLSVKHHKGYLMVFDGAALLGCLTRSGIKLVFKSNTSQR